MRVVEILLPKNVKDRTLSSGTIKQIDFLQHRMSAYVDKILDPNTSANGKEFLKSRLRDDYYDLKDLLRPLSVHKIAEAVHKLPITGDDFELIKKIMEKPIPAIVAPIYLQEIINDDELNDQFRSLEDSDPGRDVRPLVVEWMNRVMPDQMYRFGQEVASEKQKKGILSPIHGYDPEDYKGSFTGPLTGNAYGMA